MNGKRSSERSRQRPWQKCSPATGRPWSFRALRGLVGTEELSEKLSFLLFGNNREDTVAERKCDVIEEIASDIITRLQDKDLTKATCGDLEKHAYSVNDRIQDSTVRNMHILIAVGE